MNKSGKIIDHPQCIVFPFQPTPLEEFSGLGLALHFLLGNVMVLHKGLKECWFGWRVNRIFPEKAKLEAYCRGEEDLVDLYQVSKEQKVRFWLYGKVDSRSATVFLFDAADNEQNPSKRIPVSYSEGLVEFRRIFMDYLKACGHPFPAEQEQSALWIETISMQGMDILGRALELFYLHSAYGKKGNIDLDLFKKVTALAPNSFMAQNLLGWASYRNKDYRGAKESFLQALRINPHGIGAMSGLMWCYMYTSDGEKTRFWAERKAEMRGEDIKEARQKAINRMKALR